METGRPAERISAAAATGSPLMSVRGLGIRFKTAQGVWQATRKIDFDIAPGERVGIVGESGCGKTITGLSILRLLPNNLAGLDGSILFDGIDLASCCAATMRAIRGRRHRDDLSGADERARSGVHRRRIRSPRRLRVHIRCQQGGGAGADHRDAARGSASPSPERRIDEYPHQLSGGMRQRVMIAAALICGPQAADRRRADHRARRHRAGADPRTAARA